MFNCFFSYSYGRRFRWCYPLSSLFLRFVYVALVGLSIGMGRVYSSFYADFLSLSLPTWDNMNHFNMSLLMFMCHNMVVIVLILLTYSFVMVDLLRIPCCCFLPLRYVSQLGGITSIAVGRSSSWNCPTVLSC